MHCVRIIFVFFFGFVNSSMFVTFKNAQLMNHKKNIIQRIIHQKLKEILNVNFNHLYKPIKLNTHPPKKKSKLQMKFSLMNSYAFKFK